VPVKKSPLPLHHLLGKMKIVLQHRITTMNNATAIGVFFAYDIP
jgi:hypothetical protein